MTQRQAVYAPSDLVDILEELSLATKNKIEEIRNRGENISIADMFDMQMNMNHLSQISEMSGSVVNANKHRDYVIGTKC